jgi:hypothetical protein
MRRDESSWFPRMSTANGATLNSARKQGETMTIPRMTVLVFGATGSISRLVVDEAVRQGYAVRA